MLNGEASESVPPLNATEAAERSAVVCAAPMVYVPEAVVDPEIVSIVTVPPVSKVTTKLPPSKVTASLKVTITFTVCVAI